MQTKNQRPVTYYCQTLYSLNMPQTNFNFIFLENMLLQRTQKNHRSCERRANRLACDQDVK